MDLMIQDTAQRTYEQCQLDIKTRGERIKLSSCENIVNIILEQSRDGSVPFLFMFASHIAEDRCV